MENRCHADQKSNVKFNVSTAFVTEQTAGAGDTV
jgi:hypothetical protein